MRIAFVTSHLTVYGGGGVFLVNYANELSKRRHEVTIIAQKVNKNLYKFNPKIQIIEVGGSLPSKPLYWIMFPIIVKKFMKALIKLEIDVIISLNFPSNYISSKLCVKSSLRHLFFCNEPFRFFHDKKFYNKAPLFFRFTSGILRIIFKRLDIKGSISADKIIYNSSFTRKRGLKWYGRDGTIHHIGIPINNSTKALSPEEFKKRTNLDGKIPIIFTLGLSHQLKGASELIILFNKILKEIPEAVLLIGGWLMKENETSIRKLINKFSIPSKNVIFCGFIEDEFLDLYYQKAVLTLYTPIDEAYGLIPLESMKNGTPVIAFEGGPSDTVLDGKNGYIIKNYDLRDFAVKAIKILRDPNLSKSFSENGIQYIKQSFAIENTVSDLEKFLEKLVSSS